MGAIYGLFEAGNRGVAGQADPIPGAMSGYGEADSRWTEVPGVVLGHVGNGRSTGLESAAAVATIAFDGRLDNRAELDRALGLTAQEARGVSDAGAVLRGYLRWGLDFPERLHGAYACGIWDRRTERLVCVRDHMGLRPLYWWRSGSRVVFATDVEGILATGVPRRPDETALAARVADHHGILKERSFYAGVSKLPPGELVSFDASGAPRRGVHWAPGPRPPLILPRAEDYADALRERLAEVVRSMVRPQEAIAAHFSGGLDSTSIAVMAHRELRAGGGLGLAHLFSWSPPPEDGRVWRKDERQRLERMAESVGVPISWVPVTVADLQEEFSRDVALLPNETTLYEYPIARRAQELGIDAILSGWGGDEGASFNGRGYLEQLALTGRWATLCATLVERGRREGRTGRRLARHTAAGLRSLAARLLHERRAAARRRLTRTPRSGEATLDDVALLRRDADRRTRPRRDPQATQIALLAGGHLSNRVEAWAYLAARFGFEYRFPLLDRRMLDLVLSFPSGVWVRDGYARWVFRKGMEPVLPAELCWGRPKDEPARVGQLLDVYVNQWSPALGAEASAYERALARSWVEEREALRPLLSPSSRR